MEQDSVDSGAQIDPLSNPFASLDSLSPDLSSLNDLAMRGAWRSILEKVSRSRSLDLLKQPHHHLTYLSFNVLALSKLRRFADANSELESLQDLDGSDYRYETYPKVYPGRSGSMVPFSLRWIHCIIPIKLGRRNEGLDRLYKLLDLVREKLEERKSNSREESLREWKRRELLVINTIIGDHLFHKEFSVCLDLIRNLLSGDCLGLDAFLLSELGYIQLQIGDLDGAKGSFSQVEGIADKEKSIKLMNLVSRNKALIYLVGKDYVSAVREYEECMERDHTDAVAINNKAICLMYLRDLSDSIKVLENSLERVPTVTLNETLVVNLCSMYELAYVNHAEIKKTLSNWIARVAPDDFDSSCTRI
ncbi:hypothetical protein SAY87_009099 [Trapa incisa]|uniref:Trafficking protein particle complex subunit 12 n=1 Tax=Trapa incisa TaxID=236973 RepID=A0AAN7PWB0_9MYRT|nr:hypothetical protein SAY87_009099 [Trapa incisa]